MKKKTKKLILELLDFWPMTIVVPTMIILILTANLWNWQNMIADKQMKCCICETEIDNGMDYHNSAPLGKSGDVCCTYCNITKVIPERLKPHNPTLIEQKYQDLADCIRSDQLSARQVVQEFEDKKFNQWYRKKYEI